MLKLTETLESFTWYSTKQVQMFCPIKHAHRNILYKTFTYQIRSHFKRGSFVYAHPSFMFSTLYNHVKLTKDATHM